MSLPTVNVQTSTLCVKGSMLVPVGGSGPLDQSLVALEDLDSDKEELVLLVLQLPSNGKLVRLTDGKEEILNSGDVFTLLDLKNKAVHFMHDKDKSRSGELTLRLVAPQLVSPPRSIMILAVSLQPPCVLSNRPLMVNRGEAAVITQLVLQIQDNDNPEDVTVLVLDPPRHGRLTHLRENQTLRHFKLLELGQGQLCYVHDGSDTSQDQMLLLVNDGNSYLNLLFSISVAKQDSEPPHVSSFIPAWVTEGGMTQFTKYHLKAEFKGSSNSQILYSIVPSNENPRYGEVLLLLPHSVSGPPHGKQHLPNRRAATAAMVITSFTQRDIDEGHVWYWHSGPGAENDEVQFQVSSEGSPDSLAVFHTITIRVLLFSPGVPQPSPECNMQITAFSDSVTKILPSVLFFTDTEVPSEKLVYSVTKPLAQEQGTVEHKDKPHVPVSSFTQADINNVSNGNHTTPEMDLIIDLLASGSRPPGFMVLDSVLEVNLGGSAPVGKTAKHLAGIDLDMNPDRLRFEVVEAPLRGTLLRAHPDGQTEAAENNTFTFYDIKENGLQYQHGGGDTEDDSMTFVMTHDLYVALTTVKIKVLTVGKGAGGPQQDLNMLLSVDLSEKSSTLINCTHLTYVDNKVPDDKISFKLASVPKHGILTHSNSVSHHRELRENSSFTMEDVNQNRIWYTASSKINSLPLNDTFHFTLCDEDNNCLDNQMCSVTVTSVKGPKPEVTVHSKMQPTEETGPLISVKDIPLKGNHKEVITNSFQNMLDLDAQGRKSVSAVAKQSFFGKKRKRRFSSEPLKEGGVLSNSSASDIRKGNNPQLDANQDLQLSAGPITVLSSPFHTAFYTNTFKQHLKTVFLSLLHFTFQPSQGPAPLGTISEKQVRRRARTTAPEFENIDAVSEMDGAPRVVTNLGLQWLEYVDNKVTNVISKKELLSLDPEGGAIVYEVTTEPLHGFLEFKLNAGVPVHTFSQGRSNTYDINLGLIFYVLNEKAILETMDTFEFLVKDNQSNVVNDNMFHIQWSLIFFEHTSYDVSEMGGIAALTVRRTGNLNHRSAVLCHTEQDSATSASEGDMSPGHQDYVEYAEELQFEEGEDTKVCTIAIKDDEILENTESFYVVLDKPVHALLGGATHAKVHVVDAEDVPMLQFDRAIYHVSESAGFLFAPVQRKGDPNITVSVLCHTVARSAQGSEPHAQEPGSDFIHRGMSGENRVVFGPAVRASTCDVGLVDDEDKEPPEEFQLVLSEPSDNARLGDVTVARVVIDGPNDDSSVFLANASFAYSEDAGTIEIPVLRQGTDLSSETSVWCATRPSNPRSAMPGADYIPSSKKVEFKPGETEQTCSVTILDDAESPAVEGMESFVVFLSSAQGAKLTEPSEAAVVIVDTFQDIPSMQFEKDFYAVKEMDSLLHIPIIRTGDLTFPSSVRCYTETLSALEGVDFEKRRNAEESRITFLNGEKVKNCTIQIRDDSVFEPTEEFWVHLGSPVGDHWSGAMMGRTSTTTVIITDGEDVPTIEFEDEMYQVRHASRSEGTKVLNIKVVRRGDRGQMSKVLCSTRDGSAKSGMDYNPKSEVLQFSPGMGHIFFQVEVLSNENQEWHETFSVVLGPDEPMGAVFGETTMATVTILAQEAAGNLILPAPPIVVSLSDYDQVEEVYTEGSRRSPSSGYPLVCVIPCDPHHPKYPAVRDRCKEEGISQASVRFSWEVAAPADVGGTRAPFETVTDSTPYTNVNHMVLDSIYFSRRFQVRCVVQALDRSSHLGTPLRSNIVTIGSEGSICHTPITTGGARGFQAQSFVAMLKYLDVKHKEHPNRIHISVQIPHQDGMLPLVSTAPLHDVHLLLSEPSHRRQHACSNLGEHSHYLLPCSTATLSETGFLDDKAYENISRGPGYDWPYQFNSSVRDPQTIRLYKHLSLKTCTWTFDAYYDMTELVDICGGSITADFQVRDSAQSFLTVRLPLYVSYIYVMAPRGWASLEHQTEMEFSFFYDTVLWRTGIQTNSVLSAKLQISRIYIQEDGRLVIEFKTQTKFRGQFVAEHHTLPGQRSHLNPPDQLGKISFDLQLLWSTQSYDSPYQMWRATSSYSRKDYSGEYTIFLIPCTVPAAQSWTDPGDKPLPCTAHAPEKFLLPIAFQQTNRPVPVVYSLNTEFQLCKSETAFMMDPATLDVPMAEMDYKGTFSIGQTLYGRVLWNPEQSLNVAYKLQLQKVYLCTGRDGYVPFFDPTGSLYNEGPQYGCIQPNKQLRHRFLLLDRKQPDACDRYFHDVAFDAKFASESPELQPMMTMPGMDGFTMKVDALYKVEAGNQWYLQVIYVIRPQTTSSQRIRRRRRDLGDTSGQYLGLDESLIYDNEGDQVKNGTNIRALRLEKVATTYDTQTGGLISHGVVVALVLVAVGLLAICFLLRVCRQGARKATRYIAEEYPLNTKVEVCLEKSFHSMRCTVKKVNILNVTQEASNIEVKQVNLEVKLQDSLNDGTEV
ncbi:extracellular matrix protein FRAS1-like [Arapaima gigas]